MKPLIILSTDIYIKLYWNTFMLFYMAFRAIWNLFNIFCSSFQTIKLNNYNFCLFLFFYNGIFHAFIHKCLILIYIYSFNLNRTDLVIIRQSNI